MRNVAWYNGIDNHRKYVVSYFNIEHVAVVSKFGVQIKIIHYRYMAINVTYILADGFGTSTTRTNFRSILHWNENNTEILWTRKQKGTDFE